MIMCTDVERVSPMPAIAANCESTSESDEHLASDRDSGAEARPSTAQCLGLPWILQMCG